MVQLSSHRLNISAISDIIVLNLHFALSPLHYSVGLLKTSHAGAPGTVSLLCLGNHFGRRDA